MMQKSLHVSWYQLSISEVRFGQQAICLFGDLVGERQYFNFANVDSAAWIMLLEGKMSFFEGQAKIQILIEFIAIDGDLNSRHLAATPDIVTNFKFVRKPSIRLDELLVNMAMSVQ